MGYYISVDTFTYTVKHQHIALCTVKIHILAYLHTIFEFIQAASLTHYTLHIYIFKLNVLTFLYRANLHIFTNVHISPLAPMATSTQVHLFRPFFTHKQQNFTQSWIVRIVLNCISAACIVQCTMAQYEGLAEHYQGYHENQSVNVI